MNERKLTIVEDMMVIATLKFLNPSFNVNGIYLHLILRYFYPL